METRDVVGSFMVVEARDLKDAIRIASLHPAANMGESLGWDRDSLKQRTVHQRSREASDGGAPTPGLAPSVGYRAAPRPRRADVPFPRAAPC